MVWCVVFGSTCFMKSHLRVILLLAAVAVADQEPSIHPSRPHRRRTARAASCHLELFNVPLLPPPPCLITCTVPVSKYDHAQNERQISKKKNPQTQTQTHTYPSYFYLPTCMQSTHMQPEETETASNFPITTGHDVLSPIHFPGVDWTFSVCVRVWMGWMG
ncbi:hypothetical protein FN846DRAFT_463026 [Sphaerosporella brunnea]|uniref:Secreted protein n=1 Tax=Sphaerosporella brunnea TaxID=1250544 RepID=A0A5J5EFA8_9PEZI|nr:hypothetical protein FN846DRAFT_463026 [Sphaerosporella brunnea]